ncbi:hypothetical protein DdX_19945 [Ditylenchus destructor]|uniref:Uncharacterized protein n=1 Tax=Ditylenchus destructor TaxID=166010 RepID=A0AAD4QTX4_9BILA|nr:hypothetical protein DdX_19945 [Ditylenchus destructor]
MWGTTLNSWMASVPTCGRSEMAASHVGYDPEQLDGLCAHLRAVRDGFSVATGFANSSSPTFIVNGCGEDPMPFNWPDP